MKKLLTIFLIIIFVTIGIPVFAIISSQKKGESLTSSSEKKESEKISVYIKNEDKVCEMDMEQYLKEVVSAEMPADFHPEALKAQAVAARTYLINRKNVYEKSSAPDVHKGAIICTDPAHCKAWISESERKKLWKENSNEKWAKISEAVDSAKDIIITYNGEPISAVFHSTSSGKTENAVDVWGNNVDYLKSVESEGDRVSPKLNSSAEFTITEFKKIAADNISGVNWDLGLVSDIERSEAGGIKRLKIGGVAVKGTDFRTYYKLRSTHADINISDTEVKISVLGYGHGVGMSQYGANYLANRGKNYEEILKTYYTGVELSKR